MRKKIIALLTAATICMGSFTGCIATGKEYGTVKKAQEAVGQLDSGRITVTTAWEKSGFGEHTVTEFVFRRLDSENFAYCCTQYDRNQKPILCDYSDGVKTEQWLIGKGWSDKTGALFTADQPHRYITFLSTPHERKTVRSIQTTQEDTNCRYDITLDPDRLNKTVYRDEGAEAVEEQISLLLNGAGELVCLNDDAILCDIETGEEIRYQLEMQISDRNSIGEITRPELREHYRKE